MMSLVRVQLGEPLKKSELFIEFGLFLLQIVKQYDIIINNKAFYINNYESKRDRQMA